jgi:P-type conjugative transfer protein TrbJ
MRAHLSLCVLLLCLPHLLWASGWPVFDAANFGQTFATAVNTAKNVTQTAQQIENEVTMIRNQVQTIANQVRNLQRLDLTSFQDLLSLGGSVMDLLGDAQGISFDLAGAQAQFEEVYRFSQGHLGSSDLLKLRMALLQQSRYAQTLSLRLQSIRGAISQIVASIGRLLNGSYTLSGNLDAQQLAHQQQVLAQYSALQMQQMQAAAYREQTLQHAEKTVLQQTALMHFQERTTLAPLGDWQAGPQLEMRVRGSLR